MSGMNFSVATPCEKAPNSFSVLERGMTILLVEQYVDFARSLARHYAILSRGQVVDRGEVANLNTDEVRRHLAV